MTSQINKIKKYDHHLASKIEEQHGFLTSGDIERLSDFLPDHMVLIRCGNGRFITRASSANHFVDVVRCSHDYVRDVSLLVDDYKVN